MMENGNLYERNFTVSEPLSDTKSRVVAQTMLRGKGDPGFILTAGTSCLPNRLSQLLHY